MGMLDQMLANLYRPAKQDKNVSSAARPAAQSVKSAQTGAPASHSMPQLAQTAVSQGQFLRGEVLDLRANQILVLLENGATVSARTEGTLNLSIGENARFFVTQTTEDQIFLKLTKEDTEAENPMIEKALTTAGITRTEKSVSIVTELLSHSQPVTESNIRHYLSLSAKYPELPAKDFILMELHQIPVNADTVAQFASYHDGNGKLLTQATALLDTLTTQLEMLPEGDTKQQLLQELTQILTGTPETSSGEAAVLSSTQTATEESSAPTPSAEQGVAPLPTQNTASESTYITAIQNGETKNPAYSIPEPTAAFTATNDSKRALTGIDSSVAEPVHSTTQPDTEPLPPLQDFLDSFLLTPEEVADSEKVKEYYEKLQQKAAALEQLANKIADKTGETVSNTPKQMRSNLSFMESVNQAFPFLQLPLKFKETPAHGELYVYERKKAVKQGDTVSALLHLELDALGTLDIFVTLAAQNVTTRFSSSDKASADLIQAELPALKEALAKGGYSLQAEITVHEPETDENVPTLLEQFLEEHAPGGLERYTFDIRA